MRVVGHSEVRAGSVLEKAAGEGSAPTPAESNCWAYLGRGLITRVVCQVIAFSFGFCVFPLLYAE